MSIDKEIRKLARSNYWQNIYRTGKEIGSIHLFENHTNLSGLQSLFLFWLNIYDSLYTDLSQKEWKYLDEEVINNDTRCDAFLYWRGQIREQELDKHKREEKVNNLNLKNKDNVTSYNVDFT